MNVNDSLRSDRQHVAELRDMSADIPTTSSYSAIDESALAISDAEHALRMLWSAFPKSLAMPVPVALLSQVYRTIADRTEVDRALDRLQGRVVVRLFRVRVPTAASSVGRETAAVALHSDIVEHIKKLCESASLTTDQKLLLERFRSTTLARASAANATRRQLLSDLELEPHAPMPDSATNKPGEMFASSAHANRSPLTRTFHAFDAAIPSAVPSGISHSLVSSIEPLNNCKRRRVFSTHSPSGSVPVADFSPTSSDAESWPPYSSMTFDDAEKCVLLIFLEFFVATSFLLFQPNFALSLWIDRPISSCFVVLVQVSHSLRISSTA